MAPPRRLVLFVEGEGDRLALPLLVKQLLTDLGAWSHLFLDTQPFIVGNVAELMADNGRHWVRWLNAARRRPGLGAVLLVQDGDLVRIRGEDFCAVRFARRLGEWSRGAGAGTTFSVASVFACMEFESWLLACVERLAGRPLLDGRPGLRPGAQAPPGNLEQAPRDAKKWLGRQINAGYKPARDQGPLTQLMVAHLDTVRARDMRSFGRLENALRLLKSAVQTGTHIVSPAGPSHGTG